ncbi:hypothetical protein TNCV_3831351 [Trichonephila clavipes]|nr:hypothetical protein TNCV_3831351 [Trichonephila clavipes]
MECTYICDVDKGKHTNGRTRRIVKVRERSLRHPGAARSVPFVDIITQFTSTHAPLKYCEVFSSDITPTTDGPEKINAGFHRGAGTSSVIRSDGDDDDMLLLFMVHLKKTPFVLITIMCTDRFLEEPHPPTLRNWNSPYIRVKRQSAWCFNKASVFPQFS